MSASSIIFLSDKRMYIIYSNSQTKRNRDEVAIIRNSNACFYTSLYNGYGEPPGRREHAD